MAKFVNDQIFKNLTQSLQLIIAGYETDEDFTDKQRKQVETLVKLERKFKRTLQKDHRGELAYKKFIKFILEEKRNILAARPYFRERQDQFAKGISLAIKQQKHKKLYKFDINYPFINFIIESTEWAPNSKVRKIAAEVCKIREELVHTNMPLAISRARIFRGKTPESHLDYMDIVQISFEGLLNAIDKFVLPYTTVFRSVIIGRILGDQIENFGQTLIHFYPSDKRKIYRANKAKKHQKELDYEDMAKAVNGGTRLVNGTTSDEIQQLVLAASTHNPLMPYDNVDSEDENTEIYASPEDTRPDNRVENSELNAILYKLASELSMIEKKLLVLKGIEMELNDES